MPSLAAICLKDDDYQEIRKVVKKDRAYMRRHSLPWGMSPIPKYWIGFQSWYHEIYNDRTFEPFIPGDKKHNKWFKNSIKPQTKTAERSRQIWTQWYHYYMYKHKLYSVFPNARTTSSYLHAGERGFEYNRKEKGLHFKGAPRRKSNKNLILTWSDAYVHFPNPIVCVEYNNKLYKKIYNKDLAIT